MPLSPPAALARRPASIAASRGTLAAVRQTETQRAGLQSQLKRARTPEEEAGLRDKIGQADLALQRLRARLSALDQEATVRGVDRLCVAGRRVHALPEAEGCLIKEKWVAVKASLSSGVDAAPCVKGSATASRLVCFHQEQPSFSQGSRTCAGTNFPSRTFVSYEHAL